MLDQRQALADALSPRPGASPGLMRRRYSMPETIMRKYRLAQLRSDSDDSEPATAPSRAASPASLSPARGSCASLCEPPAHRFIRRDRELMRKSALLRRLWGGGKQPLTGSNNELAPCVCSCDARYCSDKDLYDSHIEYGRESKSLDGSRSELRHASVGYPRASRARDSHPPAGWATPKRQRLDSPSGLNSSDEMLRTAMRNSYDRAEEHRHEKEKREESTSDSTFQSHGRDVSSVITSDGSRFTETPESADAAKPRKRRQSVCIYMNSLESPSAEIKSETVTATPEDTESLSISQSRTGEHTESSNSTFVTTEVTSTNHYSDSTGGFDTASTNEVHYRDSLETQTASSNEKSEDNQFSCIIKGDSVIENTEGAERLALVEKSPTKITESTTEILEIVVSETLNSTAFIDNTIVPALESNPNNTLKLPSQRKSDITKQKQHMDLDEYVSNILVESLNSLTDQIEEMNASMGGDRKISIVEKEIKVKLQNTGMNTIVHLSPTSNNPIIFGNEELYNKHEENDSSETATRKHSIGKDIIKLELTDNNDMRLTDSSETVTHYGENSLQFDKDNPSSLTTENLNQAVLQQIQKLFQDGLEQFDPKINYPGRMVPEISHIEISNVDVFIDDNSDPNYESNDKIEINTDRNSNFNCTPTNVSMTESVLGEVGTGTYFPEQPGSALVPRFSAFPNTDSMEVNTSSSDDAEVIESDCTSLVDSLDDPNSPRSALLRRSYGNRRSELVRSAIDILDLLPDMADNDSKGNKEKNEAFFIRIRDNDCDCEKENVVVADHMPDKIKQRLYRRHKKRELRMQYAKRKKIRQIKCDIENQRQPDIMKSKKEVEKDCSAILKSLIDEVIMKIAEEEHKCMRIKQKIDNKKIEENVLTSTNKKPKSNRKVSDLSKLESFKITKNGEVHFCKGGNNDNVKKTSLNEDNYYKSSNKTHVRGKLYLQPHSPVTPDDYGPKRVYHKSEIHEGNKCIEILEILEYVESSQSSPDSTNSDENLNHKMKSRKSRIPIPIYERIHKIPRSKNIQKPYKNSSLGRSSPNLNMSENLGKFKMDALIANILIDAINDNVKEESSKELPKAQLVPVRRASVPQQDTHRGRSTSSLRFKQMFDIIPEEKSSLSVESSNEDINLNRRVSAPILTNKYSESNNNDTKHHGDKVKVNTASINNTSKLSKSTSTSPLGEEKIKVKSITTSPLRKSAATSPIIPPNGHEHGFEDNVLLKNGIKPTNTAKKSLSSHGTRDGWLGFYKPNKQSLEEEGVKYNSKEDIPIEKPAKDPKSAHIQYANTPQSTVRTIESEKYKQIIINHEKTKEKSQTPEPKHRKEDTRKPSLNAKETKRKKDKNKIDFFEKFKDKDTKSKRQTRLVHSLSDPQTRTDFVIKKTDTKKIQMISVEKSEEETFSSKALKLPAFKDKQLEVPGHSTSDSDSDSAKSLLCSLAPKWLSMGNGARQKRQMRKKASQEQQNQNNAGSSIHACASVKKPSDSLPDVDTYKSRKSKSKNTVKMPRRLSLHCWLPDGGDHPRPRTNDCLAVTGCAIIPEAKPRVPTMSERDLTRVYTPRHYLRS